VAGSLDDVRHTVETATLLFILMSIALLIVVAITGNSLTRRVFRAIDNIVCQARRIGEASLSERLPHPGTRDEIGRLVDTLNEMLDRLEQSFEIQRRFTSDASHELRSPLNRLRTELEVTARRPREIPEYLETLNSCAEEVLQMTEIVDELLMLARLDAGLEKVTSEMVSINQLIKEVVEKFLPQASSRQIHFSIESSSTIEIPVASGALRIVLNNLVDNAIKFSPNNSIISIGLKPQIRKRY
jgi:two-component system OmpR family sensor kinase